MTERRSKEADIATLITTKFNHRHDTHATVPREKLCMRLNDLMFKQHKVAVVEAPAGYGKTTALSQWRDQLAQQDKPSGWISLEPADDDPMRFLSYLSAALKPLLPHFDFQSMAAFLSSNPVVIDPLLSDLNSHLENQHSKFVLFLDDYHCISSHEVHEIVTRLIRETTDNIAFVISGRFRSPLPFTQLKVNDRLIEIAPLDLRFSTEEVRKFLRDVKGIGINDSQIDLLRERAEGWIAGLQLAALALKDTPDPDGFIEAFSGNDRDITDYLGDVVLNRQPSDLRDFLLRTSVLDRLNSSLCKAVTGCRNSQAFLERVEAANLFLFPLDRDRNWYRYHQMFSDFLRSKLEAENPGLSADLLRTACNWSIQNGHETEAVEYAFRANDISLATSIIADTAPDLARRQGKMHTVLEWVKRLPPGVISDIPAIQIANAWSLTFCRRWQDAYDQLDQLEQTAKRLDAEPDQRSSIQAHQIRASVEMNRAIALTVQDRFQISRRLCAKWLDDWPDGDTVDIGAVATALVYSTVNTFEFEFGRQKSHDARYACERCGNYYAIAWNFASLGMIELRAGRLREAINIYKEGLEYIETVGESRSFMSSLLSIFMAEASYEAGALDKAEEYLREARPFLNNHGTVEVAVAGYGTQAEMQLLSGNTEAAMETLKDGENLGYRSNLLRLSAIMSAKQIAFNLRLGRTAEAERLAETAGFLSSNGGIIDNDQRDSIQEIKQITKVRLFSHQDPKRALSIVNDLFPRAKRFGRRRFLLSLHILRSMALWLSDRKLEAQREMDTALQIATPQGFNRVFADEGPVVHEIVKSMHGADVGLTLSNGDGPERFHSAKGQNSTPRVRSAQRNLKSPPDPTSDSLDANGEIEKLTRRERQILQLIESGQSNCELADSLFISEQTVKWHLHNLYGKLGVKNRTGAIARARKLELL